MTNNRERMMKLQQENEEDVSVYEEIETAVVADEEDLTFNFPAGYVDENGTNNREFEIREMNGADEESLQVNSTKNSNNGKMITKLLERCIVRIGVVEQKDTSAEKWREIIKGLCVADQDYAFLKIRKVSLGDEMEQTHVCPECGEKVKTFFNVDELEITQYSGDPSRLVPFELSKGYTDKKGNAHKTGVLRLPNGTDREVLIPVATKNLAKGTTLMLTRICKFDDNYPISEDVIRNLSTKDRRYLTTLQSEMADFGVNTNIEVTCPDCGEVFKGNLNSLNFR